MNTETRCARVLDLAEIMPLRRHCCCAAGHYFAVARAHYSEKKGRFAQHAILGTQHFSPHGICFVARLFRRRRKTFLEVRSVLVCCRRAKKASFCSYSTYAASSRLRHLLPIVLAGKKRKALFGIRCLFLHSIRCWRLIYHFFYSLSSSILFFAPICILIRFGIRCSLNETIIGACLHSFNVGVLKISLCCSDTHLFEKRALLRGFWAYIHSLIYRIFCSFAGPPEARSGASKDAGPLINAMLFHALQRRPQAIPNHWCEVQPIYFLCLNASPLAKYLQLRNLPPILTRHRSIAELRVVGIATRRTEPLVRGFSRVEHLF